MLKLSMEGKHIQITGSSSQRSYKFIVRCSSKWWLHNNSLDLFRSISIWIQTWVGIGNKWPWLTINGEGVSVDFLGCLSEFSYHPSVMVSFWLGYEVMVPCSSGSTLTRLGSFKSFWGTAAEHHRVYMVESCRGLPCSLYTRHSWKRSSGDLE